jgi:predicted RND superfamily exporter protein
MMIIVFRSVHIGLISMFPNVFPIIITLGFMGLTGIWLDAVRTLIASIAIGLAVDDTIHFISRYRLEFNRMGHYGRALHASMRGVGRAITITTIILVIGYTSATLSKLNVVFYFGMLSAMCVFIALLADYFVCPALILLTKPFGAEFDVPDQKRIAGTLSQ